MKEIVGDRDSVAPMSLEEFRAALGPEVQHYAIRLLALVERAREKRRQDQEASTTSSSSNSPMDLLVLSTRRYLNRKVQSVENTGVDSVQSILSKLRSASLQASAQLRTLQQLESSIRSKLKSNSTASSSITQPSPIKALPDTPIQFGTGSGIRVGSQTSRTSSVGSSSISHQSTTSIQSSSLKKRKLPLGWVELLSNGNKVYFNVSTNERRSRPPSPT